MDHGLDLDATSFGDCALGAGLDPEAAHLIACAGLIRDQPSAAQPLLERARALAPRHPAPLVALYRFHFYGHRLAAARAVGEDALAVARTALGPDFGDEAPTDMAARHHPGVRFYLFALKGLAYLNLRLGDSAEARRLLRELRRLDPADHVGGALLSHVLARHEALAAGLDDGDALPAPPARGWLVHGPEMRGG